MNYRNLSSLVSFFMVAVFASCSTDSSLPTSAVNDAVASSAGKGGIIAAVANPVIALEGGYQQGNKTYYSIAVMNADGSNLKHLIPTQGGTSAPMNPTWSHNGTQISYLASNAIKRMNVSVVNGVPTASSVTTMYSWTSADSIGVFMQAWSSVGNEVAFPKRQYNASIPVAQRYCKIMVLPTTGGSPTELYSENGVAMYGITYSPDGSKIAFTTSNLATSYSERKIKVISRSDGSLLASYTLDTTVANGTGQIMDWSRSGANKLVFRSNSKNGTTNGPNTIFTFDLDAANPTPVQTGIPTSQEAFSASWSPDNTKLVYPSNGGGGTRTYTFSSNSNTQINATVSSYRINWKR